VEGIMMLVFGLKFTWHVVVFDVIEDMLSVCFGICPQKTSSVLNPLHSLKTLLALIKDSIDKLQSHVPWGRYAWASILNKVMYMSERPEHLVTPRGLCRIRTLKGELQRPLTIPRLFSILAC
jgi:hypothetical protein